MKALIFDVDGTLADNERDGHRVALNLAFRDAALDWDWDVPTYDILLEVFGGKERIHYFIERYRPVFAAPAGLAAFVRDLHRRNTEHYVNLLKSGAIPLRPGVARLLSEAHAAGLKLAVASTTTPENVTTLLTATLGERSVAWFDVIAAGDVVPLKKPAPDIFLYALDRLGLANAECLAFEDSASGLAASPSPRRTRAEGDLGPHLREAVEVDVDGTLSDRAPAGERHPRAAVTRDERSEHEHRRAQPAVPQASPLPATNE